MKRILLIFLALIFIFSCGKKSQSTQTKISFFGTSAMLNGGPQMNGGIIVVGHRVDDSEKFTIGLQNANDEKTLDLQKGVWEFGAIGWEGSVGLFTGLNQCAYSGIINLDSAETAITFNLDYATCANIPGHGAIVSNPDFMATIISGQINQFKPITLHSCNSFTPPSVCAGKGLTGSIKVIATGSSTLESSCQTPLDANGMLVTDLHLPVGNFINGKDENIMKTVILAFQSADCTGVPIEYRFNNSMYTGINQANLKAGINTSGATTDLYLEHNPTTVSSNIGYSPFGFGKDGDLTLNAATTQDLNDFAHIDAISGIDNEKISFDNTQGTTIGLNDEIMWYVNSETTNSGECASFFPGLYGFAQVIEVGTVNPKVLTLNHPITDYKLNNGTNITLVRPTNTHLSFDCSMQIVRVPHYRHVSSGVAGVIAFHGRPFDSAVNFGGIFPIKVSNGLDITAGQTLTLNATGNGKSFTHPNNPCPANYRCINMGDGSVGAPGGGIVLTWINQLNTPGGNSLKFAVNGQGGAVTGGDGGHIENKIGIINNVAVDNFMFDISGGPGTTPGTAGTYEFQFCQNSLSGTNLNEVTSPGAAASVIPLPAPNCSF